MVFLPPPSKDYKGDTRLDKTDIKSMELSRIQQGFTELGLEKYRAEQVFSWLQRKGAASFEEMTNVSVSLREKLSNHFFISCAEITEKFVSKKDGTVKYLFRLHDGLYIEGVLMQYKHGTSICISTQVGCRMNCSFCATGKQGLSRNLLPGEMLSQIQSASKEIGGRISNVVMMGMGEPLDNYENVLRFLALAGDEKGMNIGMRHISLSTCGIVDKIYDLADRKLQITLSVSLHAPFDDIRSGTMPIGRKWNIAALMKACKYYTDQTGRRISFEYAMIDGVNDDDNCAERLKQILRGIIAHVNLIPVNRVEGAGYRKSSYEKQKKFVNILQNGGITATVRRTLGSDIEASCGQLKQKFLKGDLR